MNKGKFLWFKEMVEQNVAEEIFLQHKEIFCLYLKKATVKAKIYWLVTEIFVEQNKFVSNYKKWVFDMKSEFLNVNKCSINSRK